MKNNFKKISAAFIAGMLMVPTVNAATLEERVAELEANQSLNIFNFSGTFMTRYDDIITAKQTKPSSVANPAFDNKDLNYMRLKFQFNADANVSKNIKFYSRMTASKFYNVSYVEGTQGSTSTGDLGAPNAYANSGMVLEKAYMDLTVPDTNFTFSVGRLPTTGGQPYNYLDGRARMGTYPLLAYNSYFDGMSLSYKLDDYMPQDNKLALRLIYTPLTNINFGTAGAGGIFNPPTSEAGANVPTQAPMGSVQVDYSANNWGWVGNFGAVLQYLQTSDIYIPGAAAIPAGNSSLNIKIQQWTLATEFNSIGGSNFDLSASYLMTSLATSGSFGALGGFGNSTGASEDITGANTLLSARYRLGTWILGAEWAHGEKNSFYFATAADDLTNFYGTPGNAYHLYVTKKFTENLALRVGYMSQAYDYTDLNIGATADSDRKIETTYANLRLDF
ncbi:DUF3373 domain-containing protein [Bdellovibrio sp. SKB1291214]|uniref:DUF3373 family protein n=1 Tax=Bdellovibrio sp. SKB1291214 TaxID=1732569 RepID=UPI000B51639D|nr:DUF3373 family protein [Bdellovibrio sp. SKB1291214]UYL10140.1 DUF3373 domain-containing protein [Bdellovibrio sp. SKB1291214]